MENSNEILENQRHYCELIAAQIVSLCNIDIYRVFPEEIILVLPPYYLERCLRILLAAKFSLSDSGIIEEDEVKLTSRLINEVTVLMDFIKQGEAFYKEIRGLDQLIYVNDGLSKPSLADYEYLEKYEKNEDVDDTYYKYYFLSSLVDLLKFRQELVHEFGNSRIADSVTIRSQHLESKEIWFSFKTMKLFVTANLGSVLAVSKLKENGIQKYAKFIKKHNKKIAERPRPDPLNELINKLLGKNSALTEDDLLSHLTDLKGGSLITDIDDEYIHYNKVDGVSGGKEKSAKIKGLKDRLSRAKKAINSH